MEMQGSGSAHDAKTACKKHHPPVLNRTGEENSMKRLVTCLHMLQDEETEQTKQLSPALKKKKKKRRKKENHHSVPSYLQAKRLYERSTNIKANEM
jgi:hypothetical protein